MHGGWLAEEGIEVGEQRLDEVRAALIAGAAKPVGGAGTDEVWHGFIKRLAEFDGLEVLGFVVDAGQCQGFREACDSGEEWHPIDPSGKITLPLRRWRKQELPVRRVDTEVFLAAVAAGDDLRGFLHFIEDLLDGFGEVAGRAGDGGGVAGVVGEQPREDFRARNHS